MSNKKIYKNRLSLPIFDNKGIGNGNGVAYIPNVIRGGSAIPIGNNMFLMRGRSHAQGGIDIGKDLEVEGNEVVQNGKFGTKVFSSVPFLRGVSPAERVLRGENPDTVFAAQEIWKRVHKVADDGSKRAALGLSLFRPNSFKVRRVPINDFIQPKIEEIETPEVPTYVLKDDEKPVGKKVNPNVIGGGRLYNGYAVDNHEGENVNGIGGGRVYNDTSTPTTHALPGKNKYSEEEIYNQRRMGLDSALDELHISSKDREKYYDLLIPQSVLEPGWTIPEDNNYFGHLKVVDGKRVKIRYANPKDAWLKHIKNLNTKWPNWITANNQKEYFDIINNESLGLHTLQDWKDYVAKNPTKNAYIYAPAWENNIEQYVDSLNSISNKFKKYKAFGGRLKRPFGDWLKNAIIGASVAENPAVATASGWKQENGNWVQKPDTNTRKLANNLAEISLMSPTNPITATIDKAVGLGVKGYKIAKVLSELRKELDSGIKNIRVPKIKSDAKVRTRVGDVEIDNPLLTYRQGDASIGADFLNTGIVSMKNGSYENPMFAQGKLFYGSPLETPSLLDPSLNATKGTKSGRVFLLRKTKDITAKSDLLVSNADMANANKDSHIVSPYIRVRDEKGNIIVTKVNEDIRRVPFAEKPATSKNTILYRWKPNYGYKKVDSPKSTYVVGKEIVDDAGNLNINVDDLLEQIKIEYPYTLNPKDLINKGINGSTNLSEHIQAVVQSAQTYPLPKGVSRKEFVTAALYHDLGKIFGDFGHGTNSAIIASELNLPITKNTIKAISQHMNQQEYFKTASQLEKALHTADVGRGMEYEALIEKYPYLKYNSIVNKKQFGGMKLNIFKLGGLSRSKDYGSKDKPYPSVNKNDFAGGGRSYPIPTRADAVDALRLAGLHHRSDVRAKVYAKYPDLRKKAPYGDYITIGGRRVPLVFDTNNRISDQVLSLMYPTIAAGTQNLPKDFNRLSLLNTNNIGTGGSLVHAVPNRQNSNGSYFPINFDRLSRADVQNLGLTPNFPSMGFDLRGMNDFTLNALFGNLKPKDIRNAQTLSDVARAQEASLNVPSRTLVYDVPDYTGNINGQEVYINPDYVEQIPKSVEQEFLNNTPEIVRGASSARRGVDSTISVNRARELFKEFYHRKNQPIFETNPLVSRFYNYGWSHNSFGLSDESKAAIENAKRVNEELDNFKNIDLSKYFNSDGTPKPNPTRRTQPVRVRTERVGNVPETYREFRRPNLTQLETRGIGLNMPAYTSPFTHATTSGTRTYNIGVPTTLDTSGLDSTLSRYGVTPISSSTGVQLNPADVEAVRSGNFAGIDNDRYLPIRTTTEDWVGLGANLLGSIGSYLGTRAMLNRYPMPNKPVPAIAQKLKTRVNINPQLDTIREQVGRLNTSIDNNTSSSRVAQARKQGVSNNAVSSRNQLFGQKENAETQLINQDIMNRQRVGLYNNQIFNDYLNRLGSTRQYLANARISNFNNVLSGANQSIQDLLGRIENRDADRRNFIFMEAAYPNVNWRNIFQNNRELARSLGFRFVNN